MPLIHVVPCQLGMGQDELLGRLQSGWIMAGRQAMRMGGGIVDPTHPIPPSGVVDCDVWLLPEPMIPAGQLALYLVEMLEGGAQADALDELARHFLGQSVFEAAEEIRSAAEGGEVLPQKMDDRDE